MPLVDEIVVGVVILIGVIGAAIQIYPGSLIVAAAVVFWGVMAGGAVGWTVAVVAVVAILLAATVEGREVAGRLAVRIDSGLLADVAHVLRQHGLRVHDARIATFGERAEDLLLVSDAHNHPLAPDRRDALRAALLAALDGEIR